MSIDKRIKSLQPYVIQMRFSNNTAIVDAVFKDEWKVPTSTTIKSVKGEDTSINYHMFYTEVEDLGLDDILDFIEEIIKINVDREKKFELLKIKTEELKGLFRENDLDTLKKLMFVFDKPKTKDFDDISVIDLKTEPTNTKHDDSEIKTTKNDNQQEDTLKKIDNQQEDSQLKQVGNQSVELPVKKIVLEEYKEPVIVCKCTGDDVCPVCIDEKVEY